MSDVHAIAERYLRQLEKHGEVRHYAVNHVEHGVTNDIADRIDASELPQEYVLQHSRKFFVGYNNRSGIPVWSWEPKLAMRMSREDVDPMVRLLFADTKDIVVLLAPPLPGRSSL